jgi:hypothetical protein
MNVGRSDPRTRIWLASSGINWPSGGADACRALGGPPPPGAQSPRGETEKREGKEAAGHGDVLLQLYDLLGIGVEKRGRQQAKTE